MKNIYGALCCGLALFTFGCATAPETEAPAPAEAPETPVVQEVQEVQPAPNSKAKSSLPRINSARPSCSTP